MSPERTPSQPPSHYKTQLFLRHRPLNVHVCIQLSRANLVTEEVSQLRLTCSMWTYAELLPLALVAVLACLWTFTIRTPRNFPPGPRGLGSLKTLWQFRSDPLRSLLQWQLEYGNVVGLQLGSYKAVVLSEVETLKEAFSSQAFNGRPKFLPFALFSGGDGHGSLQSEGEVWDQVRKFTLKNLKALGFGRKDTEHVLLKGIHGTVEALQRHACTATPLNLHDEVHVRVGSYAWEVLTGERWDAAQTASMAKALANFHDDIWTHIGGAIWMLPFLSTFFPRLTGYSAAESSANAVHSIIAKQIKAEKDRFEEGTSAEGGSTNLVHAFLSVIDRCKDLPNTAFHSRGGVNQMTGTLSNLFITAGEAMSNTINWAMLYISSHPDVQGRIQAEVDDVIGRTRDPSLTDMEKMPYLGAVMKEVSRCASSSPFSNFQETTEDVQFRGFFIPKGTIVIGNIYGAHYDPRIWDDPMAFRPDRFLGDRNKSAPPIIPFSVGLRTCPGQTFARNTLFLYLAALCQRFTFDFHPDVNPRPHAEQIARDCNTSLFRYAKFYKYQVTERH